MPFIHELFDEELEVGKMSSVVRGNPCAENSGKLPVALQKGIFGT
jgi:hypothetical protein